MLNTFIITRPDDWHVHCRDQEMLSPIVRASAKYFARDLIMPNLQPPLTTVSSLIVNQGEIELVKKSQRIPDVLTFDFGQIVPVGAGHCPAVECE